MRREPRGEWPLPRFMGAAMRFSRSNTSNPLPGHRARMPVLVVSGLLVLGALAPHRIVAAEASPPLSATVIQGASAYTPLQLLATYRAQLGQPADRATAETIAAEIEKLYARDGYSKPELQMNTAMLGQG